MESLRSIAISTSHPEVETSLGKKLEIENLKIRFNRVDDPLAFMKDTELATMYRGLKETYQRKRMVTLPIDASNPANTNNEVYFGELAVLKCLQKDGWDGVWVDTYHNKFWNHMKDGGTATLPPSAKKLYDDIVNENNGKRWGFFDVLAWRNDKYIFLEYKGKGDSLRKSQRKWLDAAAKCKIDENQLFFISYTGK